MAYLERFVAFSILTEESGKSLQRIKAEYMKALGLHSTDALFLAVLHRHPEGLTAADLARACKVDRAVVSRSLPTLLSQGAVAYKEAPTEGRTYRSPLVLTEKGCDTVAKMRTFTVDTVRHTSADITNEELAVFYRTFRKIERRLAAHAEELEEKAQERKDK